MFTAGIICVCCGVSSPGEEPAFEPPAAYVGAFSASLLRRQSHQSIVAEAVSAAGSPTSAVATGVLQFALLSPFDLEDGTSAGLAVAAAGAFAPAPVGGTSSGGGPAKAKTVSHGRPGEAVVILIMGDGGDVEDETDGLPKIAAGVDPKHTIILVEYSAVDEAREIAEETIRRRGAGGADSVPVVIVGHSAGGQRAIDLVDELDGGEVDTEISLLVIDAVRPDSTIGSPSDTGPDRKPRTFVCIYQDDTEQFEGGPIEGATNIEVTAQASRHRLEVQERKLHTAIDDLVADEPVIGGVDGPGRVNREAAR